MNDKIAISVGDPSGIGPELVDALSKSVTHDIVVFGHRKFTPNQTTIDVVSDDIAKDVVTGSPNAAAAHVQWNAFQQAVDRTLSGEFAAVVTAPWTKSILTEIGHSPTGHTEVVTRACNVERSVMLLAGDRLRVALATAHIPVANVSEHISLEGLVATLEVLVHALQRDYGIAKPTICVCGLNPHAGEQGTIGREELDVIEPAIEVARQMFPDAVFVGPKSADTLFIGYVDGAPHDAVLAMYHDQGLIPLKTIHFSASANITLGLPIIRTSVDHGTAHDIAGKGIADGGSLTYALKVAKQMIQNRRHYDRTH